MEQPLLEIKDLHLTYRQKDKVVKAVDGVNLTIQSGEIFGIIGYSGAGKSSLLRCMNLLEVPTQGAVLVNGRSLTELTAKQLRQTRTKIGMIFQQFHLIHSKTVAENIVFNLKAAGFPKQDYAKRVTELLDLVGLGDKANRYPGELSGGQKQRVGIARALANNPRILLCDEATSALDPETTQQILALLKSINQKLGITIVMVTHEMEVIKSICHRVAVMEQGQLVEVNSTYQAFARPESQLMKQFVANLYDDQLPDEAMEHLRDHTLLTLVFSGEMAERSFIDTLKESFAVSVSILHGNIEYIQGKALGHLTIALQGESEEIRRVKEYLERYLAEVKEVSLHD